MVENKFIKFTILFFIYLKIAYPSVFYAVLNVEASVLSFGFCSS